MGGGLVIRDIPVGGVVCVWWSCGACFVWRVWGRVSSDFESHRLNSMVFPSILRNQNGSFWNCLYAGVNSHG